MSNINIYLADEAGCFPFLINEISWKNVNFKNYINKKSVEIKMIKDKAVKFEKRRFPNLIIKKKSITGTYKNKYFNIFLYNKDNPFYKKGEKRYSIDVYDQKSGMYDVETYEIFNNIIDALKYALEGAML